MTESPSPYPTGSWRLSRRSYRHTSPSPPRSRLGDDLLLHKFTPRTAVDMFRSPPPALKASLDLASASDQSFAIRAAVASKKIQEWLDELSEWYWPPAGGSAGFEAPHSKRRRIGGPQHSPSILVAKGRRKGGPGTGDSQLDDDSEDDMAYRGCLPESQVMLFERRVDEIDREMKEIDLEDIKRHVLHNHIMPLSRPGTPFSDTRSTMSTMSISKMDDLTAVITTIVMQALPNLSKLSRLMNVWSTRISVLVGVPGFLTALEEAEVALRSAWNAISLDTKREQEGETLSKDDYQIMRRVLLPRIIKAGRELDRLLDILEGMNDTLPDSWLDRMETVERGSSEWVHACEQKIKQSDWTKILGASKKNLFGSRTPSVATAQEIPDRDNTSRKDSLDSLSSSGRDDRETTKKARAADLPGIEVSHPAEGDSSPLDPATPIESTEYSVDDSFVSEILAYDKDLAVLEEEDEDQYLPNLRRESEVSQDSPLVNQRHVFASSAFDREATPELPRQHGPAAGFVGHASSPPSSPPVRKTPKGSSKKALAKARPRTPVQLPSDYIEETGPSSGPRKPTEENSDAHLQQQISDILESIPAKIRLAPEPASAATLNPPDLPIQRIKQKKTDANTPSTRTTSSMSSRAGTPSFTLAPAFGRTNNPRPTRARGNPEIKLYHLSRTTGEAPIKLFIRCVGERGERVMVRVGGGWADLGEYLKEYATHHRRSGTADAAKVEIRGINNTAAGNRPPSRSIGSSPPSRPASSLGVSSSPITPLMVRKTRRSIGATDSARPRTPLVATASNAAPITTTRNTPPSHHGSIRSRSSSWSEEDSSLGLAGPTGKRIDMSNESRAWVESVKEKVRLASGERKFSSDERKASTPNPASFSEDNRPALPAVRSKSSMDSRFGHMGKVGSTKRLFRKGGSIEN
ncbi:uncharacterized protein MKZ38_005791 [Zalerion maritima]|uniref:GAR domain-containing protein n=1 Tax=Zalerion maritima TaxID=339359 RepID=A0AAD5RVU1_9PEZI|nr:uncharacterized protein MKZ38_005791 [Zalerion maritima]